MPDSSEFDIFERIGLTEVEQDEAWDVLAKTTKAIGASAEDFARCLMIMRANTADLCGESQRLRYLAKIMAAPWWQLWYWRLRYWWWLKIDRNLQR